MAMKRPASTVPSTGETRETQIAGQAVPGHSTRKVTYVSAQGNNTRIEKYALLTDGTWALTDTADYEYDRKTGGLSVRAATAE